MGDRTEYFKKYRQENKEKERLRQKKWRDNNPEKYKAKQKRFLDNHPGINAEYTRRWKIKNPTYDKEYRDSHKEENAKRVSEWYQNNKEHKKETTKTWSILNRVKISKQKHLYGLKNREQMTLREKSWRKANLNKVYQYQLKNLEKQAKPLKLDTLHYKMALKSWSELIKSKYENLCQICYDTADHTHHIFYRSTLPLFALNENNGIPLCITHHNEVHGKMIKVKS